MTDPEQCPCNMYRTAASLTYKGHVISTDPSAFRDPSLKQLWQYGRKYRLPNNPAGLIPDVRKGIDEYIDIVSTSNKMDPGAFQEWAARVIAHVEKTVKAIPDTHWVSQGGLGAQGYKEFRAMQEHMVIAPTDKSQHDFMYACKTAYLDGLYDELESSTYARSSASDEQIWEAHTTLSQNLGRLPIRAHGYLYGAGKLHKENAGMRWIVGCSRQVVHKRRGREFHHAATSISATASALGAALRFCMRLLEDKDEKLWRPKGIRRYWIVTSVDTVAKHIKAHQKDLAQEEIWTNDFTTMYTKLPIQRIHEGVTKAIHEAFSHFVSTRKPTEKLTAEMVRFKLEWTNYGDCTLVISEKGPYHIQDILTWMQAVLTGTYIKQGPDAPTLQQMIGVPMGGKASAELANLYCYSVESATIDKLIESGNEHIARSLYHTMRYIDDILGFGEPQWQLFDYQMEHKKTSENAHSVVFLGMRITTTGDYVQLTMEPKGAAWKWKPQRYVEWSSIHTKDTRRMLLKGLLVRAGTITNSMPAFKEAVSYYVNGLYVRGFQRRALMDSFESYMKDYWTAFPHAANDVRQWFKNLLRRLYDNSSKQNDTRKESQPHWAPASNVTHSQRQNSPPPSGALLCGLDAINHIMTSRRRPPITRDMLDDIAKHIAHLEASIRNDGTARETQPHREGNYHVTVITLALAHLADLHVSILRNPNQPPAFAYVIGDGSHWQAIIKDEQGWSIRDKTIRYIKDLPNYIKCLKNGIVLACYLHPTGTEMDVDTTREKPTRKRSHNPQSTDEEPMLLAITLPPNSTETDSSNDTIEPGEKRVKQTHETDSSTPLLLAHLAGVYQPLKDDVKEEPQTQEETLISSLEDATDEWVEQKVGATTMLYNEHRRSFRCLFCKMERPSAKGIAMHTARYCAHNPNSAVQREVVPIDDEEEELHNTHEANDHDVSDKQV